ncbi:MAG TPA: cellulase family glycosylhydrolase [Roseiflexaceae bacterium]|nr:cellulase family glycosylhydrolase [Roseiflexaceae bacterium]
MQKRAFAIILSLAILSGLVVWPLSGSAAPRSPGEVPDTLPPFTSQYFQETQHAAMNSFATFWRRTPNALFVLGYPISQPFIEESFTNPGEYYRVQYFERAVLEEHPENAGSQYYILGRLMGNQIIKGREAQAPFQPVGDPGDGTFDDATGHTLRDGPAPFRSFWLNNGGLEVFGRPKSEQFQEVNQADGNTYWVQYFERQRMEWHPNEPDPQYQILLGLLGNEYRDAHHTGEAAFGPISPDQVPAPPSSPPPSTSGFIYGYNALLYNQGSPWQDRQRVLRLSKESGVYWIRQQVRWMDLHDRSGTIYWGELDSIANDASAAGVKLLISVVAAPSWATPDGRNGLPSREHFSDFNYFMGEMAARYRGKIQAYEIWNEQNLAHENGGRVANANFYMDMLVGASQAIRANDPSAIIVSGAPSSTETNRSDIAISDITFTRQMFADPRFRSSVDVVGVHPGGQSNPPDTMWPDNPGPGPGWTTSREFYFRRVEDIRAGMVDAGLGDMKIWITEFGWATRNNTPGYGFGNNISYQEQADWIVRAFQMGRQDYSPWVGAMFLWQLNYAVPWKYEGNELHEQASYGVINGDWSPRPSYAAIQAMPK